MLQQLVEKNAADLPVDPPKDWDPLWRQLSRERKLTAWLGEKLDKDDSDKALSLTATIVPVAGRILEVRDLPADTEVEGLVNSGHPIANRKTGRLWRLCREWLLGAATRMIIRAVDTRTPLEYSKDEHKDNPEIKTPGEVEVAVALPDWAVVKSEER